MRKLLKHLNTVHIHRKFVRQFCWKMGLFWQGILHDLSKYSISELKISKYYTGKKSPHQTCREEIGYSPSWIHHYHSNRHHCQFWIDEFEDGTLNPIKMPYKYIIESFCDMIGAGKAYSIGKGVAWKTEDPYNYYMEMCKDKRIIHKDTEILLIFLLERLKDFTDENKFIRWYNGNKSQLRFLYNSGFINKVDMNTYI